MFTLAVLLFAPLALIACSWACPSFSTTTDPIALFRPLEFYLEEAVPDLLISEFKSTVLRGDTGVLGMSARLRHLLSNGRRTKENLVHKGSTGLHFPRGLICPMEILSAAIECLDFFI